MTNYQLTVNGDVWGMYSRKSEVNKVVRDLKKDEKI